MHDGQQETKPRSERPFFILTRKKATPGMELPKGCSQSLIKKDLHIISLFHTLRFYGRQQSQHDSYDHQ